MNRSNKRSFVHYRSLANALSTNTTEECHIFLLSSINSKVALTIQEINENINNVRDAVTLAYPTVLAEWDPAKIAPDETMGNSLMVRCILLSSLIFLSTV